MQKPFYVPSLTALSLAAAALFAGTPALGQQEAPAYTPPPYILIAPANGQNPYLMYIPVPQAAPAATAPVPPQAPAAPPPPADAAAVAAGPSLSDLGKSLRNYFTEDELDLLFEYMKESVVASFKGEEVSLPPDLAFKLEILLVRLQKEGGQYMDNLVKQLERDLKRSLQEKLTPPPLPASPTALPPTEPASAAPLAPPPAGSSKLAPKKAARHG